MRVTPEDRQILQRAADMNHLDLTTYIRQAALRAALRSEAEAGHPREGA